jgi:predicted metallo-beta-lactamase superfamily hydrolase
VTRIMLRGIRIVPLAAESLGVRSMCTYVETPDVRILLDAGVSLCPNRFGLPPHPEEFKTIVECRRKIAEAAGRAEVVTISHYHFDHHTPSFEDWLCNWTAPHETAREIYEGKTVLMKNPNELINYSQRHRAWMFQLTGGKHARKLVTADGQTFTYGNATQVRFSEPVFHGPEGSELGWVLMTTVEFQGERFMFAPDVQGPMSMHSLELILAGRPQCIMIGGPPTYLADFKASPNQIQVGLRNLEKVVENVPLTILEHHILRDENWVDKTGNVFGKATNIGHRVLTSAEYLGRANMFLEADRKRLFDQEKPSKEFEKWMQRSIEARRRTKPPV